MFNVYREAACRGGAADGDLDEALSDQDEAEREWEHGTEGKLRDGGQEQSADDRTGFDVVGK